IIFNFIKDLNNKRKQKSLARTTYNELNKLSDRELKDIGLSRGDIRSVAEGTFWNIENSNLKGWT
ncbi:DUF1127 domain-containing protein, partial [Arthrospira platensis SPKY1]|nr:DUF1127 domain-containing protein [Arthrospira platensis SPKY1]